MPAQRQGREDAGDLLIMKTSTEDGAGTAPQSSIQAYNPDLPGFDLQSLEAPYSEKPTTQGYSITSIRVRTRGPAKPASYKHVLTHNGQPCERPERGVDAYRRLKALADLANAREADGNASSDLTPDCSPSDEGSGPDIPDWDALNRELQLTALDDAASDAVFVEEPDCTDSVGQNALENQNLENTNP